MKQPSLEEVKEYFKNAKKVKCAFDSEESNITKNIEREIYFDGTTGYWIDLKHTQIKLWCFREGYAKILTYKEKTFSITESQIKELCLPSFKENQERLKELFPEAFENEVKLEVGKWYHTTFTNNNETVNNIFCFNGEFDADGDPRGFGFNSDNKWFDVDKYGWGFKDNNPREATEQEVFEALKNEAVKRGFSSPCIYKPTESIRDAVQINGEERWGFIFQENKLLLNNYRVFHKGKWAELVESITISEAEQQLKKKIIV